MDFWKTVLSSALLCTAVAVSAGAQTAAGNEARTAARLEALRSNPAALRAMLVAMPKGGDLHVHLSGAVYAETFLQNAAADNLCVDPVKGALLPNQGLT